MKRLFPLFLASVFTSLPLYSAVRSQPLSYHKGSEVFEGLMVYPDPIKGKVPAVLVVHNWMGLSDETKHQAERIASLGYVVFAVDIYGKGIRPKNAEEAGAMAGKFKKDRTLFRERLLLALDTLKAQSQVDTEKLAIVGYCFGGTAALELGRAGGDLKGFVSIHGSLDSPSPLDGKNFKGRVLALHGADDPYVKADDLNAFENEMRSNHVDWELVKYGGTVHSFTDRGAGSDTSKGAAYNAKADARSFDALRTFLKDIF